MKCTGKCNPKQLKDNSCPHIGIHTLQNNCMDGQCNGKKVICRPAVKEEDDPMKFAIQEALDILRRHE